MVIQEMIANSIGVDRGMVRASVSPRLVARRQLCCGSAQQNTDSTTTTSASRRLLLTASSSALVAPGLLLPQSFAQEVIESTADTVDFRDYKVGYKLKLPNHQLAKTRLQLINETPPVSYQEAAPAEGLGRLRKVLNYLDVTKGASATVFVGPVAQQAAVEEPLLWPGDFIAKYYLLERQSPRRGIRYQLEDISDVKEVTKAGERYIVFNHLYQGRRSKSEAFDQPLRNGSTSVLIRKVDDKYRLFAYDLEIRSELWPRSEKVFMQCADSFVVDLVTPEPPPQKGFLEGLFG